VKVLSREEACQIVDEFNANGGSASMLAYMKKVNLPNFKLETLKGLKDNEKIIHDKNMELLHEVSFDKIDGYEQVYQEAEPVTTDRMIELMEKGVFKEDEFPEVKEDDGDL
jgi:hypothetical protein